MFQQNIKGENEMHAYLKIKVVSLAAEARLIRHEENIMRRRGTERAREIRAGLRSHRVGPVRLEARAACLAYAFLRGREYLQVEAKAHSLPDWSKVAKLVERYCEGDRREVIQRFAAWKDSALERLALAA